MRHYRREEDRKGETNRDSSNDLVQPLLPIPFDDRSRGRESRIGSLRCIGRLGGSLGKGRCRLGVGEIERSDGLRLRGKEGKRSEAEGQLHEEEG